MVLNEPETSLHPDLMPALAHLIGQAAERSQLWVVSHSPALTEALERSSKCTPVLLQKELGETRVAGQSSLIDRPSWAWPPT